MKRRPKTEEERINGRLTQIHHRMNQIAEIEANAAPVGGYGARGEFENERTRLIAETEELLDRLTKIGKTIPFQFR